MPYVAATRTVKAVSSINSRTTACSGLSSGSTLPPGNSHRLPHTPEGGRFCTKTRPARRSTPVTACTGLITAFLPGTGRCSTMPRWRLLQNTASGQTSQRGFLRQTSAPSSIMAWLCSRARPSGTRRRAQRRTTPAAGSCFTGLSTSNTRAMTRSTLASTQGSFSPKAMLAMAPAVYGPTPGRARMASRSEGNAPPCSAMILRAAASKCRARE